MNCLRGHLLVCAALRRQCSSQTGVVGVFIYAECVQFRCCYIFQANISSPANVDANVEFMKYQKGETNTYLTRVTAQVEASKAIAEAEGVVVPTTVEDYCISSKPQVERIDSMESDVYGDDDCPSGTYHLEYYLQRVIYLPATMIFIRHRIFCAPSSVPPLSPPSPRPLPALSGFLLFSFFCAFFLVPFLMFLHLSICFFFSLQILTMTRPTTTLEVVQMTTRQAAAVLLQRRPNHQCKLTVATKPVQYNHHF